MAQWACFLPGDSHVTITKNKEGVSTLLKKWPETHERPKNVLSFQLEEDIDFATPLLLEKESEVEYILVSSVKSSLLGKLSPHHHHHHGRLRANENQISKCIPVPSIQTTFHEETAKQGEGQSLRARTCTQRKSFCCPKIKCWGRKRYYSWIKWEKMVKCDIKMQHTGISLPL